MGTAPEPIQSPRPGRACRFHVLSLAACIFWIAVSPAVQAAAKEVPREFTILHFSDLDQLFPEAEGPGSRTGGFAYLATLMRRRRAAGPVLALHAGDFLSPSILSNKLGYEGGQMIGAMNLLNLDAVTFGNHEFDFGCDVLVRRMKESDFPWLSANIAFPPSAGLPPGKLLPYKVSRLAGMTVAVFGLSEPVTPVALCAGGRPISFVEPMTAADAVMRQLRETRVDMIVALTHMPAEEEKALAERFPDIDVIVGGHDHRVIVTLYGKTLHAEAGADGAVLGVVGIRAQRAPGDSWVIEKSWVGEPVDAARIEADPRMAAFLAPFQKKMGDFYGTVGETLVPLDARDEVVREGESNFGDLVADLMRSEMKTDIALFNGGSFRTNRVIGPGPVTRRDIESVLPYQNRVLAIEITGRQLLDALENGLSMIGQNAGRFPQISGMAVRYSRRKQPGQRVLSVTIAGAPLDPEGTYTVATTDFMIHKGSMDGYSLPAVILRSGDTVNELLLNSLREGPIDARVDGRMAAEEPPGK